MKKLIIIVLPLATFAFLFGGWLQINTNKTDEIAQDSIVNINETELLIEYLESNGDFINTPNIEDAVSVSADEVFKHIGDKKYHIVDLREANDYYPAHIYGAVHVESSELADYMKSIPLHYIDKVVLVCYAGQKASYNTGLLRLLGYNKVYFMKWGMSAWSKSVAEANWFKNLSNRFAGKLQPAITALPEHSEMPTLYTFKTKAKEILEARVETLLQEDYFDVRLKSDELMANTETYFKILYEAHQSSSMVNGIEGSFIFTSGKSLKIKSDLQALPATESIVVTSYNGHTAGLVTAYLRTIGYDARFLTYGLSSLAVNSIKEKGIEVFSATTVKNFSTVSRKEPVAAPKPKKAAGGC